MWLRFGSILFLLGKLGVGFVFPVCFLLWFRDQVLSTKSLCSEIRMPVFSTGIFGKTQTPMLFEEGPKGPSAFPRLKATASWVSVPLPFPLSFSTLLWWPEFSFQPSHGLPSWPWSVTRHPLFPCQKDGDAASPWEVREDKCHAGTWGSQLLRHRGDPKKHSIAPYSLTSILPLSWHAASSSCPSVSLSPKGLPLSWNLSCLLPLAFPRPLKRLTTRPGALSAGKGGNHSLAHARKAFWDLCLTNASSKGQGILGSREGEGKAGFMMYLLIPGQARSLLVGRGAKRTFLPMLM